MSVNKMAASNFPVTTRWCFICGIPLVTCKHYIRINSIKVVRCGLQQQLEEIFGNLDDSTTEYVCEKCTTKVTNVHKSLELRKELLSKHEETKRRHSVSQTPPMSPNLVPSARPRSTSSAWSTPKSSQKRRAGFSPGTPSSRVSLKLI